MAAIRGRLSRFDGLDRAGIVILGILVPGTVILATRPDIAGHIDAPALDLVLDTTATIVSLVAGALLWLRFTERGEPVALFQSAAFLTLAAGNVIAVVIALATATEPLAATIAFGQQQEHIFLGSRLIAAALVVFGGAASLRGLRLPGPSRALAARLALLLPLALLGTIVYMAGQQGALPQLLRVVESGGGLDAQLTVVGAAAQLIVASLTLLAAVVCRALWRRSRVIGDEYLAVAMILAFVAQIHAGIFPNLHPLQVSTSDFLWLGFSMTMLLGIEAETRVLMASLATSNRQLEAMRMVEVERAATEERNRLSRELHDGLAQDLWFAKLKAARLADVARDAVASGLAAEVSTGIDAALADARQALIALRDSPEDTTSIGKQLQHYVDDFADRFGLRIEFEEDRDIPSLPVRSEAELLHIAHEALMNAARHADPSLVRVRLSASGETIALSVSDNGRGFDPSVLEPNGHLGLTSMAERAGLLGGEMTIDSRPHDGTRITVTVPVNLAAAARA